MNHHRFLPSSLTSFGAVSAADGVFVLICIQISVNKVVRKQQEIGLNSALNLCGDSSQKTHTASANVGFLWYFSGFKK